MSQKKITIKYHGLILALCTLSFLCGLGNCTPFSSDECIGCGDGEAKAKQDEMEVVLATEFQNEPRIFGNLSNPFGNNSILTVAGFIIVGIVLFGKAIKRFLFSTVKFGMV